MEYWDYPLEEFNWPCSQDPVLSSSHNGTHCLFYDPKYDFRNIPYQQHLDDLCNWANEQLAGGIDKFFSEPQNHYDIANLVKLDLWIASIREQGIIKPWLLLDDGIITCGTGESRLRCLERIPEIKTTPAFISTHHTRAHLYSDLERVETFDQFAKLCGAKHGQQFLFRLTDVNAPYGMYWYEYNSEKTRSITPGQDQCLTMFRSYLEQNPGVIITPQWFDQPHWPIV